MIDYTHISQMTTNTKRGECMQVLQVRGVQKSFGDRDILKDINFDIKSGEKIGIVGWNGAGKTTLVKMIMGTMEPDQGTITRVPSSLRIGYLPQSTDFNISINEELMEASGELVYTSSQLGLEKIQNWQEDRLKHLSGGERLKLSLAKIWATSLSFLILDEPTNHLDIQGLRWLIDEVKHFDGTALIISHDRYFLDETVTKVFEIEDGCLTIYEGNYTAYRQEKQRRYEQQTRDYEKQQRKIKMIENQVSTLKQWSDKAHRDAGKGGSISENRQLGLREYERVKAKKKDSQIKSKLKRLDLELSKHKIEKPKEEMSVSFQFDSENKRGKRIVEAKGISKKFNDLLLFEKSHFYVKHGEKVGLIGANGTGKTTLIKMLLGEETVTKGSLWKSNSIRVAYLSQDVSDLPLNKTALEYLDLAGPEKVSRARTIFANMGMDEQKLTKSISTLSLGERTRIKLVHMIMQEYDILILDEPTNHLDLPSREQLESTLSSFTGTLIIVSHDFYFMNTLVDKLLVFEEKRIKRVEFGLKQYEESKIQGDQSVKKQLEEELSLIDTNIAELLGKIGYLQSGTEEYNQLDKQLIALMARKKKILGDML